MGIVDKETQEHRIEMIYFALSLVISITRVTCAAVSCFITQEQRSLPGGQDNKYWPIYRHRKKVSRMLATHLSGCIANMHLLFLDTIPQ